MYKGTVTLPNTDIEIELEIHDTTGERALSRERQISYRQASLFMVCLNLAESGGELSCEQWLAEIRQVQARKLTPVALVLTKRDLLDAD